MYSKCPDSAASQTNRRTNCARATWAPHKIHEAKWVPSWHVKLRNKEYKATKCNQIVTHIFQLLYISAPRCTFDQERIKFIKYLLPENKTITLQRTEQLL